MEHCKEGMVEGYRARVWMNHRGITRHGGGIRQQTGMVDGQT